MLGHGAGRFGCSSSTAGCCVAERRARLPLQTAAESTAPRAARFDCFGGRVSPGRLARSSHVEESSPAKSSPSSLPSSPREPTAGPRGGSRGGSTRGGSRGGSSGFLRGRSGAGLGAGSHADSRAGSQASGGAEGRAAACSSLALR
eukprot:6187688-Pleurochrysis_carterae.AAC.1